ncbi:MAG: MucB/RseB C-terminal domain-containing protein [Gammaproteobacteria bacterium]|nr:MucB/RseB C-terminal domain-containing protein [Gammaproteobacteria bacterium]
MRALLFAIAVLAGFPSVSLADAAYQTDALGWLKKVAAAAHQLNYTGTYIYQYDDHVETSKITHIKDESGEHEKIEALDGSPREMIRNNDEVMCFKPDSNASVVVEKRKTQMSFPALLPRDLGGIAENYRVRFAEQGRAAGRPCRVLVLEPKDQYRYRHKIWTDLGTGLLLKASTLNEKNEVIGLFTFTQIAIDGQIDKMSLKPDISGRKVVISSEAATTTELRQNEVTWVVKHSPPGFNQVTVMKRKMPGKEMPVQHLVFSDGLAMVSVFIEPAATGGKPMPAVISRQGVIHVYTRMFADHQITVLGEVPAHTVMQIGNSVAKK